MKQLRAIEHCLRRVADLPTHEFDSETADSKRLIRIRGQNDRRGLIDRKRR
jgi:hypothetical protein